MTNRTSHLIVATNFYLLTTNTVVNSISNILYAGYSFVTNDIFYDWREGWKGGSGANGNKGKAVQAVQIDVAYFNAWLFGTNMSGGTNINGGQAYNAQCSQPSHKSHPIDSIYVFNAVPLSSTTLPAVRVANGAMLPTQTAPKGFTVATAQPMYVWGNYNCQTPAGSAVGKNSTGAYTWPAALMADAITILSTNWDDSVTNKMPTPKTTTVNAAMLEGIVQSTSTIYSGGVENFLRLLENWGANSGTPLWYNGSIVVMFPSLYATNYQLATGNYYNAPKRNWAFDTNYTQQAGLPPLTPQSKGVIRANWNTY